MKKVFTLFLISGLVVFLVNCNPAKKATGSPASVTTWEAHVQPLVMTHCTPCHIPAKGGNKKAYDNYANVKTDIDEMIRRIELNPGDRGFMPFRAKEKLSDSIINVFKEFRGDGVVEK
jgi:hypothetical protein